MERGKDREREREREREERRGEERRIYYGLFIIFIMLATTCTLLFNKIFSLYYYSFQFIIACN